MNAPRCSEIDYIAFLLAAQRVFSCTEAARSQPETPMAPAHDAINRLLTREPPFPSMEGKDTAALWAPLSPPVWPEALGRPELRRWGLDAPQRR